MPPALGGAGGDFAGPSTDLHNAPAALFSGQSQVDPGSWQVWAELDRVCGPVDSELGGSAQRTLPSVHLLPVQLAVLSESSPHLCLVLAWEDLSSNM